MVAGRILAKLEQLRVGPYRYVRRLVGSPFYRLRVGGYRVILDIQGAQLLILVLRVRPRETVY